MELDLTVVQVHRSDVTCSICLLTIRNDTALPSTTNTGPSFTQPHDEVLEEEVAIFFLDNGDDRVGEYGESKGIFRE